MKQNRIIVLFLFAILATCSVAGQSNASIQLLTQNSGVVNEGGNVLLQVTVASTGPTVGITTYRVRAQISVPSPYVSVAASGHSLPAGWTIVSNTGTAITICNSTDAIPVGQSRTILINLTGNTMGGGNNSGSLTFGNGNAATGCTTLTGSLAGDNPGDNSSTSGIQVSVVTPVTLTDFSSRLINCRPVLQWATEGETGLNHFEIERSNPDNTGWSSIGNVTAYGNTTLRSEYNFTDGNLPVAPDKLLYRLKMVDRDGCYKYSNALRVYINCKTTQAYVYPNPVQDGKLYVSFTGASTYAEATLSSLSGQVIAKSKINAGTSYINVSMAADGVYLLNIKDANGFNKNIKVLIQN